MKRAKLPHAALPALIACGIILGALTLAGCSQKMNANTTSTSVPATSVAMTPARARALHANEMGEIPVLMYHLIGQRRASSTAPQRSFAKTWLI